MTRAEAAYQAVQSSIIMSSTPTPQPEIAATHLSTTTLGLIRGGGTNKDPYDAGTELQRAYMRSIKPDKLAEADPLDDDDEYNSSDDEGDMTTQERYEYAWQQYGNGLEEVEEELDAERN